MNFTRTQAGERVSQKPAAAKRIYALTLSLLFLLGLSRSAAAQAIPVATATRSTTLTAINGNAGRIAANSVGDAFYVSQTDNTAYWLPRGTTTPIVLITGLSGARNVYVDPQNNVYVPSTYGGFILEVPYVGGTYATKVAAGSAAACSSLNPTAPCTVGSAGATLSYYYQPLDVGMDAAGNLYAIDAYPNGQCTAGDCVVKFVRGASSYTTTLLVNNITPNNYNAQLGVAPNGDVYFANGTSVFYVANGMSTATTVGTFTNPTGATVDSLGNVYVTNASAPNAIYEFPAVGGAAQFTKVFPLFSTYSANAVALDGLGDLFYTGYSGGTNLNVANVNAIALGSSNVGVPVAATAANIQFTFSTSTTVAGIVANGKGFTYSPGSCTAGSTYAAGTSCTVNVNYTPSAVGVQLGAVTLTTATGGTISNALLSGIGLGAAQTNDPGTLSAIGSGFTTPQGIFVDGAGNVFVADAGQNAVLRYAGGTGTPTSIGTGLSKPSSVAVDGAGNVYIADAGNGRIVEVPNVNGNLTNSAQTVISSGLGTTLSIAIGPYGNLYIADGAQSTITRLGTLGGIPSTSAKTTIGSKFTMPFAITVDRAGNVFVADYATNTVSEINYLGLAQSTVGAGLSKPSGLTTDASGSLYIADSGNSRLLRIPLENGSFNTNDQYLVGSTVAVPYGVSIDSVGNLYVTDVSKQTVSQINRTMSTLALGRAQINTTTAASNAYIGNAGNAALTLGTPPYAAVSTTPTYFNITAPSSNGCKAGSTITAGFDCVLAVTFTPTTTGNFTDLLTFSSNAANATPQTLNITGRGLNLSASTVTLIQTKPTGTASFGTPVTIQATIGVTAAGIPTGTVTFSVDGNAITNPPTIVNNVATITLQNLTGGPHVITASYSGDDNYAPSNGNLTITIAQASSTTKVAFTGVSSTPISAVPGSSVSIVATIVPGSTTAPTGGVTFRSGNTILNTTPIPLVPGTNNTFTATLPTTVLPTGSDVITATYNGDVNYMASSGTAGILISYQTFSITPQTANITLSTGQTGSLALTAASISGFSSATAYLGLTCQGLPANSACAFNPNNFVLVDGQPQLISMQIVTGQTPIIPQPITGARAGLLGSSNKLSWALLLLAVSPFFWRGRKQSMRKLRAVATLVLVGFSMQLMSGCGSQLFGVTPKGTYKVTVTATGSVAGYSVAGNTTNPPTDPSCTTATDTVPYSNPTLELTCTQVTTVTLVVQ